MPVLIKSDRQHTAAFGPHNYVISVLSRQEKEVSDILRRVFNMVLLQEHHVVRLRNDFTTTSTPLPPQKKTISKEKKHIGPNLAEISLLHNSYVYSDVLRVHTALTSMIMKMYGKMVVHIFGPRMTEHKKPIITVRLFPN